MVTTCGAERDLSALTLVGFVGGDGLLGVGAGVWATATAPHSNALPIVASLITLLTVISDYFLLDACYQSRLEAY
jgi:hypothetical protein